MLGLVNFYSDFQSKIVARRKLQNSLHSVLKIAISVWLSALALGILIENHFAVSAKNDNSAIKIILLLN